MPGLVFSIFSTIGSGTVRVNRLVGNNYQDLFGAATNVPPGPDATIPGFAFTTGACLSLDAYGVITIGGAAPAGQPNQVQMKLTWNETEFARSAAFGFPISVTATVRWQLAALITSRANGAVCEGRVSILEPIIPGDAGLFLKRGHISRLGIK